MWLSGVCACETAGIALMRAQRTDGQVSFKSSAEIAYDAYLSVMGYPPANPTKLLQWAQRYRFSSNYRTANAVWKERARGRGTSGTLSHGTHMTHGCSKRQGLSTHRRVGRVHDTDRKW